MAKKKKTSGTPALAVLEASDIDYEVLNYDADPMAGEYGHRASEKLGMDPHEVFKTLLVQTPSQEFVVGMVPVALHLDLKAVAQHVGVKKVTLASAADAQRRTGYVIGGISPLGQKTSSRTLLDTSALEKDTIIVSGGQRGVSVRLEATDLAEVIPIEFVSIATNTF